jgi:hypothetical protein
VETTSSKTELKPFNYRFLKTIDSDMALYGKEPEIDALKPNISADVGGIVAMVTIYGENHPVYRRLRKKIGQMSGSKSVCL